jgi:outer membrane lipoprotein SlyB
MAVREPTKTQKFAAYAVIGALIGAAVSFFMNDVFSLQTIAVYMASGAVAGVIAGAVRSWAGLDRTRP